MQLTPHFSLEELLYSEVALRQGIENTPTAYQVDNLRRLCEDILEPVRAILGVPLHINSGFRSAKVNAAVGGVHTSAHLAGLAADFVPIGLDLRTCFDILRARPELGYDQIIFECAAWIHLAAHAEGTQPRRQMLTAIGRPGAWTYQLLGSALT